MDHVPTPDRVDSRWRRLADSRALSAAELLVGAAIVVGHNVFRVVPDEVPIRVVLGLVSGRNPWASILAHGFIDTFGIAVSFLGRDA